MKQSSGWLSAVHLILNMCQLNTRAPATITFALKASSTEAITFALKASSTEAICSQVMFCTGCTTSNRNMASTICIDSTEDIWLNLYFRLSQTKFWVETTHCWPQHNNDYWWKERFTELMLLPWLFAPTITKKTCIIMQRLKWRAAAKVTK